MPDHINTLFAYSSKIEATSLTRLALLKYMVYTRRAIEATMQLEDLVSLVKARKSRTGAEEAR